jgi:hypothetical protein
MGRSAPKKNVPCKRIRSYYALLPRLEGDLARSISMIIEWRRVKHAVPFVPGLRSVISDD